MWRRIGELFLRIYLVVAFIANVILSIGIAEEIYSDLPEIVLWFFCFLIGSVLILFSALLLGLVIEMDKHLEMIERNSYQMETLLKQTSREVCTVKGQNQKLDLGAIATTSAESTHWRCRKCDTQNVAGALFCKGCGEKK